MQRRQVTIFIFELSGEKFEIAHTVCHVLDMMCGYYADFFFVYTGVALNGYLSLARRVFDITYHMPI